ncbi:MAG: hypothetical protein KZQ93_17550 [Candidatus Thiodiazotropha sp. (ex Monitilora ramsayi)]|nr:hypothetical protein [Candidatus Thiodiazotropha sp. (ex Monitilora ramsayi)]
MLMIEYRDLGWWYWLVTAILLTFGVAGFAEAFLWAIGLTLVQLVHFAIREGGPNAFPVQVRFWYLMLLLLALPQPLQWIFWIPTIGTWAQLIFGYCTMARLVSLFPRNRREPLSWGLVLRTFLAAPIRGNILQGLPPAAK